MKVKYLIVCYTLVVPFLLTDVSCLFRRGHGDNDCPGWLTSIPTDKNYYYGLGISGSTRVAREAYLQATQRGRAELGRTIVTHIRSEDLIIASTKSQYTKQVINTLSDTELNFPEVAEIFYDRDGNCGPADHYYVLVRIEKKRAEMILWSIK